MARERLQFCFESPIEAGIVVAAIFGIFRDMAFLGTGQKLELWKIGASRFLMGTAVRAAANSFSTNFFKKQKQGLQSHKSAPLVAVLFTPSTLFSPCRFQPSSRNAPRHGLSPVVLPWCRSVWSPVCIRFIRAGTPRRPCVCP
jgi:hypothetical protein